MTTRRVVAVVASVVSFWLGISATVCLPAESVEPGRPMLDKLLKAVEANDYDAVLALDSSDAFKAAITKERLTGASGALSPRMKQGYQVVYLGDLNQRGVHVVLWKLAFKDGGDDILAKLTLKGGKVEGFGLQ
jgi:hypothetical protein